MGKKSTSAKHKLSTNFQYHYSFFCKLKSYKLMKCFHEWNLIIRHGDKMIILIILNILKNPHLPIMTYTKSKSKFKCNTKSSNFLVFSIVLERIYLFYPRLASRYFLAAGKTNMPYQPWWLNEGFFSRKNWYSLLYFPNIRYYINSINWTKFMNKFIKLR